MAASADNGRVFYGEEARNLAARAGFRGAGSGAWATILMQVSPPTPAKLEFAGTINGVPFQKECSMSLMSMGGTLEAGGKKFLLTTSPHTADLDGRPGVLVAIVVTPLGGAETPIVEIAKVHLR